MNGKSVFIKIRQFSKSTWKKSKVKITTRQKYNFRFLIVLAVHAGKGNLEKLNVFHTYSDLLYWVVKVLHSFAKLTNAELKNVWSL